MDVVADAACLERLAGGPGVGYHPDHERDEAGAEVAFEPAGRGRVVIARGRDATDVPLLHSFGPHRLSTFKVWTYEQDGHPVRAPVQGMDRTRTARMLA